MRPASLLVASLALCAAPVAEAQRIRPGASPARGLAAPVQFLAPACEVLPGSAFYQSATLADTWSGTGAVLTTPFSLTSPGCTATVARIVEDSSTSEHYVQHDVNSAVTARPYTLSAYFKRGVGTTRRVSIDIYASAYGAASSGSANVDTCTTIGTGGYGGYSARSVATQLISGWCKISLTTTLTADTGVHVRVGTIDASLNYSYAGNGTETFYAWGLDLR